MENDGGRDDMRGYRNQDLKILGDLFLGSLEKGYTLL